MEPEPSPAVRQAFFELELPLLPKVFHCRLADVPVKSSLQVPPACPQVEVEVEVDEGAGPARTLPTLDIAASANRARQMCLFMGLTLSKTYRCAKRWDRFMPIVDGYDARQPVCITQFRNTDCSTT